MQASDAGIPPKTATAMVEVKVQRDEGELKFNSREYTVSVSENRRVGDSIGNVRASPGVRHLQWLTRQRKLSFTCTHTMLYIYIALDAASRSRVLYMTNIQEINYA